MEERSKKAPAIVFDFGGVLMDWNPAYLYQELMGGDPQAVKDFLEEIDFYTWNLEQDRGRSFSDGTAELTARFPEYRSLIQAYDERYLDTLSGPIQPVVDILRKLKEAGYPLFALSNWNTEKFALVRAKYPFFGWFDGIVISGDVGLVKPDKAIFELLLNRIGRSAAECLLIDDHDRNIVTAEGLGFQTILFQSAEQLEAELRQRGIFGGNGRLPSLMG